MEIQKILVLKKELETRLENLEKIEKDAREVIALSSDAGLAGGFHQRGAESKNNKYMNLLVFIVILATMGILNFSTIDFNHLLDIKIESILVRTTINLPFIWIAIVANINFNKYSRLEEEYAHKESLAKSFERYKEQISLLGDQTLSQQLLGELMRTNLQAFEKNPASTMEKAKADSPFNYATNMVNKPTQTSEAT